MKTLISVFTAVLLLLAINAAAEPMVTFTFDSPEQEASFHKLSNELRCLVCQNQSIADSNAGLAMDLRTEMYEMLRAGKTEDEIVEFMVDRYGDYVMYRPPFKVQTVLLWLGPMIVFFIGVYYALAYIRGQKKSKDAEQMSEEEIRRLKELKAQGRDLK
ncbi:MAG: cytochrome c-type biogenesis protein [Gammaproteobacteria bacterium]